jgi:hypothetical protein
VKGPLVLRRFEARVAAVDVDLSEQDGGIGPHEENDEKRDVYKEGSEIEWHGISRRSCFALERAEYC